MNSCLHCGYVRNAGKDSEVSGEALTPWDGFRLKLMDLRLLNALPGKLAPVF